MLGDAFAQCATRRGKGLELIPIDRDSLLKDIAAQKRGNADTASTEVQHSLLEEEMENRQAMERLTKEHSVVVNEDIASQSTPMRNAPAFVTMDAFASSVPAQNAMGPSIAKIGPNKPPSSSDTAVAAAHDILQDQIRQLKQELAEMKQSKKRKRTGECQSTKKTRREADGPATRTRSKGV